MGGVGRGTAINLRNLTGRQGTSPLNLGLGLVEARRRLVALGNGLQVGLRGEASWARLATGPGDETVDDLRAEVRRLRGGIEVTRQIAGPSGLAVTPFGAVSARRDGGGGQTGTGLEVAGGIRLRNGRLQVEAQGRRLILHSATGYAEQGVSVAASVGAGPYQEGLTLSLQPTWGVSGVGAETLWQDQVRTHVQGVDPGGAGVDARMGYGLRLPGGNLVTPFGSYGGRTGVGSRVQLGARVGTVGQAGGGVASPVELELSGERYTRAGSEADHRFSLLGIVTFNGGNRTPSEIRETAIPPARTAPRTAGAATPASVRNADKEWKHGAPGLLESTPATVVMLKRVVAAPSAAIRTELGMLPAPAPVANPLAGAVESVVTAVPVHDGNRRNGPPVFPFRGYAFEAPGSQIASGALIGTVMARDPGQGPVIYALAAGDARRFSVGASSGTITWTGSPEDIESGLQRYELTVTARNTHRLMTETMVVVTFESVVEEEERGSPWSAPAPVVAAIEELPVSHPMVATPLKTAPHTSPVAAFPAARPEADSDRDGYRTRRLPRLRRLR